MSVPSWGRWLVAVALLFAPIARAELPDPLTRDALVDEVLERNPDLEAARRAVDAAASRVRARGAWADPRLELSLAPASVVGDRFGFGVDVSQSLPLSGRNRLDREAAALERDAAALDQEDAALRLALAASRLYDAYWLSVRALDVHYAHMRLVDELGESARARYVVGAAPESAPLQAELARARLDREHLEVEARVETVRAALNGLLHRDPDAPLPPPAEPAAPSEPALSDDVSARPDLRRVAIAEDRAALAERRARTAWTPDPMVMAGYSAMWEHPAHRFMVGVGVEVPVQTAARRAAVDAAEADVLRARARQDAATTRARVALREAHVEAEAAREAFALYEDRIVPLANQRLRAARVAFEADRGSFDELVQAERDLLDAELGLLDATARHHRALAEARAATGHLPAGGDR